MAHLNVGGIFVIDRVVDIIVFLCRCNLGNVRPGAFLFFAVHLANGGNNKAKVGVGFHVFNVIGGRVGGEQIGNFRILAVFNAVHIVALYLRPTGSLVGLRPCKAHRIICEQLRFQIIYRRSGCADI